jgi:hypothetical protein
MTTSLERALEICQKLEAAGIRATTDPAAINLPAVLVSLPSERANDGMCSVTLTWQLESIVPAPNGWDHSAWRLLDEMVQVVEATFPIERSRSMPFQRPGLAWLTSFPCYQSTFTEAI